MVRSTFSSQSIPAGYPQDSSDEASDHFISQLPTPPRSPQDNVEEASHPFEAPRPFLAPPPTPVIPFALINSHGDMESAARHLYAGVRPYIPHIGSYFLESAAQLGHPETEPMASVVISVLERLLGRAPTDPTLWLRFNGCEEAWETAFSFLLYYRAFGLNFKHFGWRRHTLAEGVEIMESMGPLRGSHFLLAEIESSLSQMVWTEVSRTCLWQRLENCDAISAQPFPIDIYLQPFVRDRYDGAIALSANRRFQLPYDQIPKTDTEIRLFIACACATLGFYSSGNVELSLIPNVLQQLHCMMKEEDERMRMAITKSNGNESTGSLVERLGDMIIS